MGISKESFPALENNKHKGTELRGSPLCTGQRGAAKRPEGLSRQSPADEVRERWEAKFCRAL